MIGAAKTVAGANSSNSSVSYLTKRALRQHLSGERQEKLKNTGPSA
jgi:hypothetical protein